MLDVKEYILKVTVTSFFYVLIFKPNVNSKFSDLCPLNQYASFYMHSLNTEQCAETTNLHDISENGMYFPKVYQLYSVFF